MAVKTERESCKCSIRADTAVKRHVANLWQTCCKLNLSQTHARQTATTLTSFDVHRSSVADDQAVVFRLFREVKVRLLHQHLHAHDILVELCNCKHNDKKCSERCIHCAPNVVRHKHRPLPGAAGRPKFNHLEMVTTFTYRPSLVKFVCLFVCLGFNGTFSTNRLYQAITVG